MAARVLMVTSDRIGTRRAGMAIRNASIAEALADRHDVVLATPFEPSWSPPGVRTVRARDSGIRELAEEHDVVMLHGDVFAWFPALRGVDRPTVVDLVCATHLEVLAGCASRDGAEPVAGLSREMVHYWQSHHLLSEQLRLGDRFLCASRFQADFWIGAMVTLGRFAPPAGATMTASDLIIELPQGVPDAAPPRGDSEVLAARIPGLQPDDKIILWGGGIWDWLDPETAIRAIAKLRERDERYRLVFLGVQHPSPGVADSDAAQRAIRTSEAAGLLDRGVHFLRGWLPHEEREAFLAAAVAAVCCHRDRLETRYAHRLRLADCIWASLPAVLTRGSDFDDLAREFGVGRVVEPGDVDGLASAIEELVRLPREPVASRFAELAVVRSWRNVVKPLAAYCEDPARAPDLPVAPVSARRLRGAWGTFYRLREARRLYRKQGLRGVVDGARRVWRRRQDRR